jgi:hypothetical protein
LFLLDVDTDEPDEKSILLYIAHLYKVCLTLPDHPFRKEHDRVCDLLIDILIGLVFFVLFIRLV